jgi:NADH-quinone oxidoreductase subunit F
MPLETALQHFRQEFEQGIGKVSGDTRGDPDRVAASAPANSR